MSISSAQSQPDDAWLDCLHPIPPPPDYSLYTNPTNDYIFFCGVGGEHGGQGSGGELGKGCFSNWYCAEYTGVDGIRFWCVEQEMMYCKAKVFGDTEAMEELVGARNDYGKKLRQSEIKAIGRRVKNYSDEKWSKIRFGIVLNACRAKFFQNREGIGKFLVESYPKILVESAWYDAIWGVGYGEWTGEYRGIKKKVGNEVVRPFLGAGVPQWDAGPSEWPTETGNLLGRVLMVVREELMKAGVEGQPALTLKDSEAQPASKKTKRWGKKREEED